MEAPLMSSIHTRIRRLPAVRSFVRSYYSRYCPTSLSIPTSLSRQIFGQYIDTHEEEKQVPREFLHIRSCLVQLFPSKHEGQKEKCHENSNPLAIQRHFSLGLLKYKIQIYKYTDVHAYILSAHANIQASS